MYTATIADTSPAIEPATLMPAIAPGESPPEPPSFWPFDEAGESGFVVGKSGLVVVEYELVVVESGLVVVESELVVVESELVVVECELVAVECERVVVECELVVGESELVVVESELVVVESELVSGGPIMLMIVPARRTWAVGVTVLTAPRIPTPSQPDDEQQL
jgi:hypothetical protein